MDIDRIVLVRRPTRLEGLTRRFNTTSQAAFYVKSRKQSFDDYLAEDSTYQQAREEVLRQFPRSVKVHEIDRSFLPNYVFAPGDLILTLGQDGLVVNVAKYLTGQPILAVNPDPERFDGVLLPFHVEDVAQALDDLAASRLGMKQITMAAVHLNDGQELLAFNDLFVGPRSHTSARYSIQYRDQTERHSSSGLIISTPAGSTGWLSSLYHMSAGIQAFAHPGKAGSGSATGASMKAPASASTKAKSKRPGPSASFGPPAMDWEDRRLVFVVREPFASQVSQTRLVAGFLEDGEELILESQMPEQGIIFSDGMEQDFLEFNSGATARVSISPKTTGLIVRL